ncbi:acyl carrier protein [Kitasatospora viridis]|uniref:Phosphopantetheine binding protein n=1 Tax=Kitasatospora viridis TaxID=281105 RepID=A0A561SG44_9ACTN|nr:acyl carrier protein [Kitasatospora viridis]TWF73803.1 phosphopantetheine binding protein [Kitasatospora viridis]
MESQPTLPTEPVTAARAAPPVGGTDTSHRTAGTAPGGAAAVVEQDLRLAACGFLLVEPGEVEFAAELMSIGFDSVSLVYLMAEIGVVYGIDLEPEVVFDHPSLRDLMHHLLTEHPVAVAARISGDD